MLPKELTEIWERVTGIVPEYLEENVDYEDAEWMLDNNVFGETYIMQSSDGYIRFDTFRKSSTAGPQKIFPYETDFEDDDEIEVGIFYREEGKFWSNGKYHTAQKGFYIFDLRNESFYLEASLDALEIASVLSPSESNKWGEETQKTKEPKWGYLSVLSKQFDI